LGYEIAFNDDSSLGAIDIATQNKKHVRLTGIIDRADIYKTDGVSYIRVIDYKTGHKEFKLDDIIIGFNLQMLLYLFSIKENKNALTTKEIISCGFFYYPALLKEVSESRKKTIEQLSEELSDRLKMSGMVNYKSDIIDFDEFGKYSEILTRGKLNEEKIFNMDDLELLFNHIKNILINAGNDILSGNINVNPKEKNNEACMYCKFKSICKFDNDIDKTIKIKNYTNKEVLKKLGGEQDA
jgi:ATP-dependent helicase/nuclease subunit B